MAITQRFQRCDRSSILLYPSLNSRTESKDMWKIFPHANKYEVSVDGEVRRGRSLLKKTLTKRGYHQVCIYYGNGTRKNWTVHRMVAETFIGPMPNGLMVCHNNGKATDNRLSNLRYDTASENVQDKITHGTINHGTDVNTCKLSEEDVLEIYDLLDQGKSQRLIANQFGLRQSSIWAIANGKNWRRLYEQHRNSQQVRSL